MRTRIYIKRDVIRENDRTDKPKPPIALDTCLGTYPVHGVEIRGPCKVIYSPDAPHRSGARIWIETESDVKALPAKTRSRKR